MKNQLYAGWVFTLVCAAIAQAQQFEQEFTGAAAWQSGHYGSPPMELFASHAGCEDSCQIDWSQFSQGSLWDGYCTEPKNCLGADFFGQRHALGRAWLDECSSCACSHRLFDRSRFQRFRERFGFLNLLRRVFGRHNSRSCSDALCSEMAVGSIDEPAADDRPANPLVPMPITEDADDDSGDVANRDEEVAEQAPAPIVDAETHVSIEPAPAVELDASESNALELEGGQQNPALSVPVQAAPEPTEAAEPAPVVPRNKLPKKETSSLRSLRRPAQRVIVAERLSDYIKS